MPYACIRKTVSNGDVDVPVAADSQLTGYISPRTPCIRTRTQR